MKPPRVSVIIPYLNAAQWLSCSIGSVSQQRFCDWELLLIDDGSADGSELVAAQYAQKDPLRIRLLPSDPERRGAAAARNRGIAAARGEFVAFLDADDFFLPDKLARDIVALDANPEAAWVFSASRWHYQDGGKRDWRDRFGLRSDRSYEGRAVLIHTILRQRGDCPGTCGVMIRRTAIDDVGGFNENFRLYEDQSLWVKLLLQYPVHVRSGCDAVYRQHALSTSARAASAGEYDQFAAHPARLSFLEWVGTVCREIEGAEKIVSELDSAIEACRITRNSWFIRLQRRATRYLPISL